MGRNVKTTKGKRREKKMTRGNHLSKELLNKYSKHYFKKTHCSTASANFIEFHRLEF